MARAIRMKTSPPCDGVTAALLRAAAILNADAAMRPVWAEFLANLAPLPTSADPEALKPDDIPGSARLRPRPQTGVKAGGLLPDSNSLPMWFFDLCNVESARPRDVGDRQRHAHGSIPQRRDGADAGFGAFEVGHRGGVPGARRRCALPDSQPDARPCPEARHGLPQWRRSGQPHDAARRSAGARRRAIGPRFGSAAPGAACRATLRRRAKIPVLHLFPAWPKEWSAAFHAAGARRIPGERVDPRGRVRRSSNWNRRQARSAACAIRSKARVALYRDGKKAGKARRRDASLRHA